MTEDRLKEKFEKRYNVIKEGIIINKKILETSLENEFMEEAEKSFNKLKNLIREKRLLREIKESCQFMGDETDGS